MAGALCPLGRKRSHSTEEGARGSQGSRNGDEGSQGRGDGDPGSPAAAVNPWGLQRRRVLPTTILFLGLNGVKTREMRTVGVWPGPGRRPGVRTSSWAPAPSPAAVTPRALCPGPGRRDARRRKREKLTPGRRVSEAWNPERKRGSGCRRASADGWRVGPSARAGRFGDQGAGQAVGTWAPRAPTRGVFSRGTFPSH